MKSYFSFLGGISLHYVFIQSICHEQDVTQDQFLSGIQLV